MRLTLKSTRAIAALAMALALQVGAVGRADDPQSTGNASDQAAQETVQSTTNSDQHGDAVKAEPKSATTQSVQESVDTAIEEKTDEKRQRLAKEAVSAVQATRKALALLGENKPDEALESLKEAIGTLELVMARNPDLAFVPVMVTTRIHDLLANVETVEKAVEAAKDALDDGRVQTARRILSNLASEIVISTHELPLATYPDAIKAAVPMIDEGRIEDAKQQLQTALNSFVVQDLVVPLPETRVKAMLTEAEELAATKNRSAEQNDRLKKLLDAAEKETRFGQALGYIGEDEAEKIYDELATIRKKTSGGKSGKGLFERIRSYFDWS